MKGERTMIIYYKENNEIKDTHWLLPVSMRIPRADLEQIVSVYIDGDELNYLKKSKQFDVNDSVSFLELSGDEAKEAVRIIAV